MSIYSKPIDEITYQDISDFCDSKTPECYFVDYKLQTPSDIAKDVAAMANAVGGVILIGVRTIGEAEGMPGQPDKLIGIPDGQKELRRIDKKCGDTLYPPLLAESVCHELPHSPGNFVLLLRVPASQSAPHWLGEGDDNKIPIRVSDFTTIRRFTRLIRPSELDGVIQRRQKLTAHREALRERAVERCGFSDELKMNREKYKGMGEQQVRDFDAKLANESILNSVEVFISPAYPSSPSLDRNSLLRITRDIGSYFNDSTMCGTAHETGWFKSQRHSKIYCECTLWGSVYLSKQIKLLGDANFLDLSACLVALGEALAIEERVITVSRRYDLLRMAIKVSRANRCMHFGFGLNTDNPGKMFDLDFELISEGLSTELFKDERLESMASEILFAAGLGLSGCSEDYAKTYANKILQIRSSFNGRMI